MQPDIRKFDMKPVFIEGIGISGPGIENWQQARSALLSEQPGFDQELIISADLSLPANERRRASRLSKIALQVAGEAINSSILQADEVATVFTSSCGDLEIAHKICTALTMEAKPVSPIQFHNSVHNAQAGYWAISQHAHNVSNSISACADSFAMGLLEALTLIEVEQVPVLLVACDRPAPVPLYNAGMSRYEFAVAMLISPHRSDSFMAVLEGDLVAKQSVDAAVNVCENKALEPLRKACPAAMALPLLEALAISGQHVISLDCPGQTCMQIKVDVCA